MTDKTSLQLMGEKAAKVENFGTYLSDLPVHVTDKSLLQLSAQVMGHLVRSNVQLTAALVDNEVRAKFPQDHPTCHTSLFGSFTSIEGGQPRPPKHPHRAVNDDLMPM